MFNEKARIFSLIDLTSLNATDSEASIEALCGKAVTQEGRVAAFCIYPRFIKTAVHALKNKSINIAVVANFPQGTETLQAVQQSIRQAIAEGANEIDAVFPYEKWMAGEREEAKDFVRHCKKTCGESVLLKVILETGALQTPGLIKTAAQDVIEAGADFIKTSTGKIEIGATLESAELMLGAIRNAKRVVGLKVSGGIRTLAQAQQYIELANRTMGKDWVTPHTFRIGTSRVLAG